MKKRIILGALATVMVLSMVSMPALATQPETGNGCPSGAHYNLNIIGMSKPKNIDPEEAGITPGNGHRIFVALGNKDNKATTKILLEEGDFAVVDYDGTDGQAKFRLPNPDPENTGVTEYSVYLRVLGKPGGKIKMYTAATDPDIGEVVSDLKVVSVREKGQMKFANVSAELLYIYAWIYDEGIWSYERIPLFSDELQDYLWYYENNGVRIAQLRFYEGVKTPVPDPEDVPHLASINPWQGTQGATGLAVAITGTNTDFDGPGDDETPAVDFGNKIAVSVTSAGDTSIAVQIDIGAGAATGFRPVEVTQPDGTSMTIWFEVLEAP